MRPSHRAIVVALSFAACGPVDSEPQTSTDEIEAGVRDADARSLLRDSAAPVDARADASVPDARLDATADGRLDASVLDAPLRDGGGDASVLDARPEGGSPDAASADSVAPDATPASWESVGFGVSYRDMGPSAGRSVLVVYGGYTALLESVQTWSLELWRQDLAARGVRHVYAVQGPRDAAYNAREIQNSRLAPHLVARIDASTPFVAVAAHSSGSFPAHELFDQLFNRGYDPSRLAEGRIVYFNLDGGSLLLTSAIVGRLRAARFVFASDPAINTRSNNAAAAEAMGRTYATVGGAALGLTVRNTGCNSGATWCMHDAVVITRPYNPAHYDVLRDYTLFTETRRVQTEYLTRSESLLR